jgi:hypothetical protein
LRKSLNSVVILIIILHVHLDIKAICEATVLRRISSNLGGSHHSSLIWALIEGILLECWLWLLQWEGGLQRRSILLQ